MNINTAFPSSYLKAADLNGRKVVVVISGVDLEEIGSDHKPVLKFSGKDKGLVLNKTNAAMVSEIVGTSETDDWKGKKIAIYPSKTDFQGKRVDCIRVDYPEGAPKPAPAEPVSADDIPF